MHTAVLNPPRPVAATPAARLLAWLLPGVAWRRTLAAQGWLDEATGLANGKALPALGQPLLEKAHAAGRSFAVVVLDLDELGELRQLYGREVATRVLARVAREMKALAGPSGAALRTGRCQFTVLMPGATKDAAWVQVRRVLGSPCRIEIETGGEEVVLVPEIAAEHVARDGESLLEVYHELAGDLARGRRFEERRLNWMRRERERHSRPMPLA